MAMMDPFLGGNNAPPYPRRLASLTKTSSLGASTKQYAAQFRRPNYESPGTPTHTSFLDDLDAEINQELQQFRSGKAWQHGTMYKNRSAGSLLKVGAGIGLLPPVLRFVFMHLGNIKSWCHQLDKPWSFGTGN